MPHLPDDKQAEYAAKLKEEFGRCPRCGSRELTADDYDGDRVLSCAVTCDDCGLEWSEHYRFTNATDFQE